MTGPCPLRLNTRIQNDYKFRHWLCSIYSQSARLLRYWDIDSKESIPPAYVAWRCDNPIPNRFLAPIDCSKFQHCNTGHPATLKSSRATIVALHCCNVCHKSMDFIQNSGGLRLSVQYRCAPLQSSLTHSHSNWRIWKPLQLLGSPSLLLASTRLGHGPKRNYKQLSWKSSLQMNSAAIVLSFALFLIYF